MKKSAFYIFMTLSILSCKDQEEPSNTVENIDNKESEINPQEPQVINNSHTSRNSLDWEGIYTGVLPSDDCEGIDTSLSLNKDQTYLLKLRYLGIPEKESKEFISEGKFTWDENGNNITLEGANDGSRKFKVGENYLMPLDKNAKEIEGIPGNNYKLFK
ncbi:MAG: copper resistance protein NlpE N-terminal domain-containing protein [Flavobacteriaceae bacterium]|nr:copper resistance protein NlpE N-terminal domain-containing protein [Flavobacteriaceae bacterium]